jgi:hypothetical protein
MSKSKNEDQAQKQPSLFGIPSGETDEESNKTSQLFGISTTSINNSNSTPIYLTPAITQSLNLLELTLQKTTFEKSDFDILKSTLTLLPMGEISRLRSTISLSSLDNLAKKADIYEKTQTLDNQNSKSPIQNQINESQKLLNQEEINKLMANFLQERNDLNKNLAEKNNQLNLGEREPTKSQN